ncbi:MAG: RnfH family protein [Burkholderiaceae bacterium]|nr:RnfH family protein [Burkholderiaceae bacterium]MCD8516315.1 RnfH family protein [Burkholderiaceae bacterium]MCD8564327.1 RnfH family protein [Burkholderiaceae bacterium]
MATPETPATPETRAVSVVYAQGQNHAWRDTLALLPGMTVEQAIQSSGFEAQHPDIDWRAGGVGIFGKRVKPQDLVKPGDRIEIYRALVFDPKESRRRRALHRQRQKQLEGKSRGRQRTV